MHCSRKVLLISILFAASFTAATAENKPAPAVTTSPAPAPAGKTELPGIQKSPESTKPAGTTNNPPQPGEAKPVIPAPTNEVVKPAQPEIKPPLSAEELQRQKEAELRAQKERELAEAKAREEEARRIEAAKGPFEKLLENSRLYTGLNGGPGFGLNSVHKSGYGFGMTLDYLAYKKYGLHFGAETGIFPTKALNLNSGSTPLQIAEGGTFGYLNMNLALVYALPEFLGLDCALGAGAALYQLRGGTYDFSQAIAPFVYASAYYNLLSHLQLGLIPSLTLPVSTRLTSANSEYKLDSSVAQTVMSLHLSVRYSWF